MTHQGIHFQSATKGASSLSIMQMIDPAIRAGVFERQTAALERILGRPATSLQNAEAAALPPTPR
ncbi:MAG: hypothetical protein M3010_05400 [Candidatus Dormibacteraeota bacterium]|nr:hypothetical protein [Candidatus Dormibacteraeota bacterium]